MIAQLDLWQHQLDEAADLPWGGRSPRALTRVQLSVFLRREPQKDDRFFVDLDQLDLFHAAKKRPPRYEGAPSLLPLPF